MSESQKTKTIWTVGGTLIGTIIVIAITSFHTQLTQAKDNVSILVNRVSLIESTQQQTREELAYVNARNFDSRLTGIETLLRTVVEDIKELKGTERK